ncbi:cilia- and flagella- associated protein 210-like [Argiope bruennichi]|uniref:cilia- and flagella- associated protein 210-like n=1 Tax=Argiope bruennichi TaxID=94029 RepID=UPI002495643F|nr:cilia- and flagella- associated protein 210-like [Argiope bruennichi]
MENDPFKRRYPLEQPKKNILLSKDNINKIISHAQQFQTDEEKEAALREERERKRKASKELAATLSQRKEPGSELKKKQYELGTKFAKFELDREARTEARKNLVLEQAYKRLFEDTDRVKYFKTAKNFAEAIKERNDQIATRTTHKDEEVKYDTQFLLRTMRDVDQHKWEEQEKERIKEQNKKKNAENWRKQNEEILQKKSKEKWEHLRDGYLIRDEDERDKEKAARKELEEKERVRQYKEMLENQILDKQALFDTHHRQEEAEEVKAKLFNDSKRQMKLEHQKIKEQLDKEKNSLRQHVASTLTDEGAVLKAKEEASLKRAILEAEEKAREEGAMKQLEKEEALEAIKEFYDKEMEAKERRKYEERLSGYQEGRRIAENVDRLQREEFSKAKKRENLEKEAQHLQMHQIAKRQANKKAENVNEIKDYMNHMRSLDNEEEMFQKFAQMEIEKCEARGVDTYAMRKAARPGIECGKGPLFEDRGHIRPRYYAATWNPDDLVHVKRNQRLQDTKSRLGFTLY